MGVGDVLYPTTFHGRDQIQTKLLYPTILLYSSGGRDGHFDENSIFLSLDRLGSMRYADFSSLEA